jgi:plasmid stability protein
MAQELAVGLSNELIAKLIERAISNGRSPEEEHRAILVESLRPDIRKNPEE